MEREFVASKDNYTSLRNPTASAKWSAGSDLEGLGNDAESAIDDEGFAVIEGGKKEGLCWMEI
jgi:hypothetical protein